MFVLRFFWNLLALVGLVIVAAAITVFVKVDNVLPTLQAMDGEAPKVYLEMGTRLLETGNAAEATVWKVPVDEGLSARDVEQAMKSVANQRNIENVGELPLSRQIEAMTGKPFPYLKVFMFCNPLTAAEMFRYSTAFSAYLPCRISLIEDGEGKLWLYTHNMDMMIYGGSRLPTQLRDDAIKVKETILDIMNRGARGEL
jgi:uncharacterized protein (DUF302 family)